MINFEGNKPVNSKVKQLPLDKLEKILPSEQIDTLIKTLTERAELEMTDIGTFKQISESTVNHEPVIELGNISLNIKSVSDLNNCRERVLEAEVATKSGQFVIKCGLISGERSKILEYLQDKNFNENFKRFLLDCSDNFERKGLE